MLVLTGACDAMVRTPYRPFVEALDQLVRTTDPDVLRAELGSAGGELTRIFPDLSARLGGLPEPVAADPDTERHRLHTAVSDLLVGACRRRPLVLVIEDGHWADGPTLQLLRHLARSVPDARLLVLATFRDTDADVPAELADALADLRRSDDVVRLRLGRPHRRRRRRVPASLGRRRRRSGSGGARARDPGAHGGQRVPPVGALADAGRDGRDRRDRRHAPPDPAAGGDRDP